MDEAQRAAQVAQNLPKSEPELNPQYHEPESNTETVHGVPLADYVMTNEVMDYFNIGVGPRQSPEVKEQMQAILQFAKQNSETQDLAGILRFLRHTEVILGNSLKQDRVTRLHRYVRIQQQKALLAEREHALYA